MDYKEIEAMVAAFKSMSPAERKTYEAIVGRDRMAKMFAAIDGFEGALAEAGDEISAGAEKHIADQSG